MTNKKIKILGIILIMLLSISSVCFADETYTSPDEKDIIKYLAVKNQLASEPLTVTITMYGYNRYDTGVSRKLTFQDSIPGGTTRIYVRHNGGQSGTLALGYHDVGSTEGRFLAIVREYVSGSSSSRNYQNRNYDVGIPSSPVFNAWTDTRGNGDKL